MTTCPSEETFVLVLGGRAKAANAAAFHSHVEAVRRCSALLQAMAVAATLLRASAIGTPVSGDQPTHTPTPLTSAPPAADRARARASISTS